MRAVIHCSTDRAEAVAGTLLQQNVTQIKSAVAQDVIRRAGEDAVDYYLWRRLPAGPGSILCNVPLAAVNQVVPVNTALVRALALGPVGSFARDYFRRKCGTAEFIVPVRGLRVRVMPAEQEQGLTLPFHQDAYPFPAGWTMLNSWTLLFPSRTGEQAAGLEFIPGPISEVLPKEANPKNQAQAWIETSNARIEALIAEHGAWIPDVELGDALLFNELAPPRPFHSKPLKPRLALEFRMIAREQKVLDAYKESGIPYFTITLTDCTGPRFARIDQVTDFYIDRPA